jgi:hypothetical protein
VVSWLLPLLLLLLQLAQNGGWRHPGRDLVTLPAYVSASASLGAVPLHLAVDVALVGFTTAAMAVALNSRDYSGAAGDRAW